MWHGSFFIFKLFSIYKIEFRADYRLETEPVIDMTQFIA